MKISKKITFIAFSFVFSGLLFSCGSTATLDSNPKQSAAPAEEEPSNEIEAKGTGSLKTVLPPPPAKLTEAPKFTFSGDSLKIEMEKTYYDGFELVGDVNASEYYALRLKDSSSWAIAEINFPAGSYEGLVNVLSPDSNHSKFNVCVNDDSYLVYGSEPPLTQYELTTRSVVSFTLEQPVTVTLKIQQNDAKNPENNGQNGMTIDYISFKKK